MWVLECPGDNLKGKKIWLRPGQKFLFGRTKTDDSYEAVVVSHKTISRKHLRVEVGFPNIDDCANPRIHSKITIEDFDTKIGTLLNGNQIRGLSVELDKDENVIYLGRYEHEYRIIWVPITLTFSFTVKEHTANHYARLYKIFGPLDIKILTNYEREFTTHVVSKKRNTAKGLQALIDGKYIVHNDTFINALISATSPNSQGIIPLQDDFEENLPDPFSYLPPKGDEPTQCEGIAYVPNKLRQNIFNGYTFVFYEERQYENLLPPITAGGGEAILHVVKPYETTIDDFVNYINEISRNSDLGKESNTFYKINVVVVRFNPIQSPSTEWYADFGIKIAQNLDYRLAEQNEFLDAILLNDASILRRPLRVEAPEISASCSQVEKLASDGSTFSQPLKSPQVGEIKSPSPPRRGRIRRTGRSKLLGFDDDFTGPSESLLDSDMILSSQNFPSSATQPSMTQVIHHPTIEAPLSQCLFVSQNSDVASQDCGSQGPTIFDRKRKANNGLQEESEHPDETVLAETPFKRRRLGNEDERRCSDERQITASIVVDEFSLQLQKTSNKPIPLKSSKNKKIEDIDADVEKMIREKSERKETNTELNMVEKQSSIGEELNKVDIDEICNRIQINIIEVKRPSEVENLRITKYCDRWDERWNGRKNFKKFKRQGETRGHRGLDKVIVPLIEARKKNNGTGTDRWIDDSPKTTNEAIIQFEPPNPAESRNHSYLKDSFQLSTHELIDNEDNRQFLTKRKSSDIDSLSSSMEQSTTNRWQRSTQSRSSLNLPEKSLKRVAMSNDLGPNKKLKLMGIQQTTIGSDYESDDEFKFSFKRKIP